MLREQIAYDRNHPSIIIRSLGNELDWLPDFEGGDEPSAIKAFFGHLNGIAKRSRSATPDRGSASIRWSRHRRCLLSLLWPGCISPVMRSMSDDP